MTVYASSHHNSQSTAWSVRARKLSRLLAAPNVIFRILCTPVEANCPTVSVLRELIPPRSIGPPGSAPLRCTVRMAELGRQMLVGPQETLADGGCIAHE